MNILSIRDFAVTAILAILLQSGCAAAGETIAANTPNAPVWKPSVSERAEKPIRTILVERFRSPGNNWLEQFLTDRVSKEFIRAGTFQVVEREKLAVILNEQALAASGLCQGDSCELSPLEIKGVDAIVAGVVDASGNGGGIVELRMIDSKTGIVLQSEEGSYLSRDADWQTFLDKRLPVLIRRFH